MIDYRIDRGWRIVEVTIKGSLPVAAFLEDYAKLKADPDFDPTFAELADCRAANPSGLEPTMLQQVAETSVYHASAPRALVVKDDVHGAVAQLFGQYTHAALRGRVCHFLDMESASQWLAEEQRKQARE
jgi:hypothetical protein